MSQNQPPAWWRRRWTLAALAGMAALSMGCSIGADVIAYDLPAESARYTFESDMDGVHTEWEFTSDRPAEDTAPELRPCMAEQFVEAPPCRAEPLIFLRYDLDLSLVNTLPARSGKTIAVTGYYQQLADPPTVTALSVAVSLDGGATWQQVPTTADATGENAFRATIRHQQLSGRPGDVVSLRVNAVDDQGNTVVQTIPHAYTLS